MTTYVAEVIVTHTERIELHVQVEDIDTEDEARQIALLIAMEGEGLILEHTIDEAVVFSINRETT